MFKGVERTQYIGKKWFQNSSIIIFEKKCKFCHFFVSPSPKYIFQNKKVSVELDNNFWKYRFHQFGWIFWRLDFNDSPVLSAMINYKTKNIFL